MDSNQKDNQFGQGSNDNKKSQASQYAGADTDSDNYAATNAAREDDFLSGDNAKKTYPNNQNNPSRDYNEKSLSPRNPNIGGDESEYETSTSDADRYDEESLADNNDGFVERKDTEEIDKHIDRYSSPTTRNRSEE